MLQGMTAHYLPHSTYPLKKGDTALIHAAAGGTGRLLVQMAKLVGARVIGTAGTEAKAQLAREAGAAEFETDRVDAALLGLNLVICFQERTRASAKISSKSPVS